MKFIDKGSWMDIVPKNVKIILANSEQTGNQIGKPFLWVNAEKLPKLYIGFWVFSFGHPLETMYEKKSCLKELKFCEV